MNKKAQYKRRWYEKNYCLSICLHWLERKLLLIIIDSTNNICNNQINISKLRGNLQQCLYRKLPHWCNHHLVQFFFRFLSTLFYSPIGFFIPFFIIINNALVSIENKHLFLDDKKFVHIQTLHIHYSNYANRLLHARTIQEKNGLWTKERQQHFFGTLVSIFFFVHFFSFIRICSAFVFLSRLPFTWLSDSCGYKAHVFIELVFHISVLSMVHRRWCWQSI